MRLFTYIVQHDYGFAPNPYHGRCTLATCKPDIRRTATRGDVVVGFGGAENGLRGQLVYYMHVDDITDYDAYWRDTRFRAKRPMLRGSSMLAFGDNIYHRDRSTGQWVQDNSYHSRENGVHRPNLVHDTGRTDKVLLGSRYAYWGGQGPKVPARFRNYNGKDICRGRAHRCRYNQEFAVEFAGWLDGLDLQGPHGRPANWPKV